MPSNQLPTELVRLAFIQAFAKDTRQPWATVLRKLTAATCAAIGLGWLVKIAIAKASLPTTLSSSWLVLCMFFASFSLLALLMLLLIPSLTGQGRMSSLAKQLKILPLSKLHRWVVTLLPILAIMVLIGLFCTPLILSLSHGFQLPLQLVAAAVMGGMFSGLGFALMTQPASTILKGIILTGIVIAGGKLLERLLTASTYVHAVVWIDVGVILGMSILGYWQNYQQSGRRNQSSIPTLLFGSNAYIEQTWFGRKLIRNQRTLQALAFCLVLSSSVAIILQARHLLSVSGDGWLMFGGLLACSYASDIRGISRRFKPAEIVAVWNTGYFVLNEVFTTIIVSIGIGLPLATIVWVHSNQKIYTCLLFLGIQLAGATFGLLSSTILVPQAADLGSQFFAATGAVVVFFGVPKLEHFSERSTQAQIAGWLLAAMLGLIVSYVIEWQRRNHYVRST